MCIRDSITTTQYMSLPTGVDGATFDPNGKIIGVQQGTTGDNYYASDPEVMQPKEVKRYKSAVDAAADMALGRVEMCIRDSRSTGRTPECGASSYRW